MFQRFPCPGRAFWLQATRVGRIAILALAPPAVPAAAGESAISTVATVADLVGLASPGHGVEVRVEGYHRPGDDGGGRFRHDPASDLPADSGAVVRLREAPGRMIRVVGPDDEPRAEWFGARGDGDTATPHDDRDAINRCLAAYGRVHLLAKTYGVRGTPAPFAPSASHHAIGLGPGARIVGAGRDRTTIKLLDGTNPRGAGSGDNYFSVLANRSFHESAEHVVVSDLTIDCNFDGQDRRSTIAAIAIRGGGALVERVALRGYGTGLDPASGSSRECFVVGQQLVYKDAASCRRAAVLRDLDFTGCGRNGNLPGTVAEITHVAIGGANNFENADWILPGGRDPDFDPAAGGENERNWWPAFGGLVENCTIRDEAFEPVTQKSALNGVTVADCVGAVVRGNRVEDFEGAAVFVMSWWNRDTVIVANRFLRVTTGVAFNIAADKGRPIQSPRHEHVLVVDNEIVLGDHRHAPWGTAGISLYGSDIPAEIRMRGIHVRGNRISGRAFADARGERICPVGIKIHLLRPTYSDLRFEDNTLDIPDVADATCGPFGQAITFFPEALWAEAVRAGHVICRGNRTPDGAMVEPRLIGW